jgi:hypothetical protein
MLDVSDELVLVIVVLARLGLPLLIPRFPLPAILACLVLDGVDQSIFQQFTDLDLTNYQSYDKALDIYYLTIAYLATMRNWTNRVAFQVSRFLIFYRLVGVVLFEFTQVRALLVVFPNTFEYFFIFYEAVRTRWNPKRMAAAFVVGAAAAIWVFIKLPQEYWIHVAQLDTTDLLKEEVFGVDATSSWSTAFANRPWVLVVFFVAVVALVLLLRRRAARLPEPDHAFRLAADPLPAVADTSVDRPRRARDVLDAAVLEKVVLISLVSIVFAQILPGVDATALQMTLGVAVLVTLNALLSFWFARRGRSIESTALTFVVLAVVNSAFVAVVEQLLRSGDGDLQALTALFFVLLLTLVVTLYDRYQPIARARFDT